MGVSGLDRRHLEATARPNSSIDELQRLAPLEQTLRRSAPAHEPVGGVDALALEDLVQRLGRLLDGMLGEEALHVRRHGRIVEQLHRVDHAHDGVAGEPLVGLVPVLAHEPPRRRAVAAVGDALAQQERSVLRLHLGAHRQLAGAQDQRLGVELGQGVEVAQLILRR